MKRKYKYGDIFISSKRGTSPVVLIDDTSSGSEFPCLMMDLDNKRVIGAFKNIETFIRKMTPDYSRVGNLDYFLKVERVCWRWEGEECKR